MSLTPLLRSRKKVRLWRIFFALPVRNGPLPAELKFRENTAQFSHQASACSVSLQVEYILALYVQTMYFVHSPILVSY